MRRNQFIIFRYLISGVLLLSMVILLNNCKKNTPPVIAFFTPIDDIKIESGDTLYIQAKASDEDGNIEKVVFYVDGTAVFTDYTEPYEYVFSEVELNKYIIKAVAYDNDGEQSPEAQFSVTVNTNDGVFVLMDVIIPHAFYRGDTITVNVTAESYWGDIKEVQLYFSDTLVGIKNSPPYSFKYVCNETGSLYVKAIDENGIVGLSTDCFINFDINYTPDVTLYIQNSQSSSHSFYSCTNISFYCEVDYHYGNVAKLALFLNDSLLIDTEDNYELYFNWKAQKGSYEVKAVAVYPDGDSSVAISQVSVAHSICTDGKIVNIFFNQSQNRIIAINQKHRELIYIDPISQSIIQSFILPGLSPVAFDYSSKDNMLYIIYEYEDFLTTWDIDNETFSNHSLLSNWNPQEIKTDDIHRRIYIVTSGHFNIIDMDNFSLLYSSLDISSNIELDKENRFVYDVEWSKLNKYSVQNDSLELVMSGLENNVYDRLLLNPDNSIIVMYGYNNLKMIDVNDFSILNSSDKDERPLSFSYDGNKLYFAGTSESNLIIRNSNDLSFVDKFPLPYSNYCYSFSSDIEGINLYAYTAKWVYEDEGAIYFILTNR
jgi:hypothetical protein